MAGTCWVTSTRCSTGWPAGANSPGFRDVTLGGSAVDVAIPGYDLATGLGSPNVELLARDFLDIQKGTAPR